jgi:hypothetical protein
LCGHTRAVWPVSVLVLPVPYSVLSCLSCPVMCSTCAGCVLACACRAVVGAGVLFPSSHCPLHNRYRTWCWCSEWVSSPPASPPPLCELFESRERQAASTE